jgi:hypothetical protein
VITDIITLKIISIKKEHQIRIKGVNSFMRTVKVKQAKSIALGKVPLQMAESAP